MIISDLSQISDGTVFQLIFDKPSSMTISECRWNGPFLIHKTFLRVGLRLLSDLKKLKRMKNFEIYSKNLVKYQKVDQKLRQNFEKRKIKLNEERQRLENRLKEIKNSLGLSKQKGANFSVFLNFFQVKSKN